MRVPVIHNASVSLHGGSGSPSSSATTTVKAPQPPRATNLTYHALDSSDNFIYLAAILLL